MIKGKLNKSLGLLFCFVLFGIKIISAQIISPFNKLTVTDTSSDYSFIVSGHFHGASTNLSTFPASSLQANIDTLNSLQSLFIMSLGDVFLDVNQVYIDHYKKSLFDKLKTPLFNAVGNHDVSNGNMYEKIFGPTYFFFQIQSELFIVLNTEVDDGSIKNEQLKIFTEAIKRALENNKIKNIFVFSHRPIWAERIPKYSKLFEGNTRSSFGKNNFSEDLMPLLNTVSKNKNIVWISGSLGGGPASFFYDKDQESNVTFMQTAIRDLPRDAALKINVNNGKILFNGISFTGEKLNPVESYNLEYWSKTIAPEQKFNYRLLPLMFKQMISHYYFWIGFSSALILLLIISFTFKKWKKRK